jgi:aryl-alcohol dehydrogenase-like predicted oxidoreductase
VARAIDGGVNFFNSADVYAGGDSERILGKAIGARRQGRRDRNEGRQPHGSCAGGDRPVASAHLAAVEASLSRLGTDYLDVYLVHKVDVLTPIDETIEALEDVVRQGKVRYIGFSNWPHGSRRRRSACRALAAGPGSGRPRSTIRCSAATSSTSSCHSAPTPGSGSWSGVRSPAAS